MLYGSQACLWGGRTSLQILNALERKMKGVRNMYFLPHSLQSRTRSVETTTRRTYMSVLVRFSALFFTGIVQKSESEQEKKLHFELQSAGTWSIPQGPYEDQPGLGGSCLAYSPTATSAKLQPLLLLESLGKGENRFSVICEMDGRSSPTGPSWIWRAGVHQSFIDLLPVCSLTVLLLESNTTLLSRVTWSSVNTKPLREDLTFEVT